MKKTMKKLMALALSLVLILTIYSMTFAAEDGGSGFSEYRNGIEDQFFTQNIILFLDNCKNNDAINQLILDVLDKGIAHYNTTKDKTDSLSIINDGRSIHFSFANYTGTDEIVIKSNTIEQIISKMNLCTGANQNWGPDIVINLDNAIYAFGSANTGIDVRANMIHRVNDTQSDAYKTLASAYSNGNVPFHNFYELEGVGSEYKGFDAQYTFDVTGHLNENEDVYIYNWNPNTQKFCWTDTFKTSSWYDSTGNKRVVSWPMAGVDCLRLAVTEKLPDAICEANNNGGNGDWKSDNLTVDVSSVTDSAGLNAEILKAVQTTDITLADLNQLWIHFDSDSSLDLSSYTISESTIKTLVTAIDGDDTIDNCSNKKSVAIVYGRNIYVFWTKEAARDVNFESYIKKTTDATISNTITGAFGNDPVVEYDLYEMSGVANIGEYRGFEYRQEIDCSLNQENSDVNLYYWDENAKMFEYWGNTKTNHPTYFVNGIQDGKYVAVYGTLPESIVKPNVGDPGLGDVNGDDTITAEDALCILKDLVGIQMDCYFAEAADTNLDGSVTAEDALAVLKHLVGIEPLPGYENIEGK